ncbi:MAG: hypothetical protein KIS96_05595 [Bauldia sp.]|nr:hypothetical protein [Bauldia sp.]
MKIAIGANRDERRGTPRFPTSGPRPECLLYALRGATEEWLVSDWVEARGVARLHHTPAGDAILMSIVLFAQY